MATLSCALGPVIFLRGNPQGSMGGYCYTQVASSSCLCKPLSSRGKRTNRVRSCSITYAGISNDSSAGATPSLAHICHRIEFCFFEVCVCNLGRPLGLSLHDFVVATVEAYSRGYTREQISLQLIYGSAGMQEFELGMAGSRLTGTEEHYRSKWLDTVYITLHIMKFKDDGTSRSAVTDDAYLYSTIRRVIEGQISGEEQSFINFDRGLATRGASGGVVAGKVVIAPQLVPVSQLVLLTLKVANEQSDSL